MSSIPGLIYRPRLIPKHASETAQMARINRGLHLLTDDDLRKIRDDWDAGFAREVADKELERRVGLSAHERVEEATQRRRARG
jgi:hypothetical protein